MRLLLGIVLLAVPALAKPPEVRPFMRMDELEPKLAEMEAKLRAQEEFAAKPRQERMILRFGQGAETFEGKRFNDKTFVEEILVKWQGVQKPEAKCEVADVRIVELLPAALKKRYNLVPIPKAERYQASKVLVKALKSKHDIIRRIAIESLDAIYGRTLLYRWDASPGQRAERARKWTKEIEKLRR